MKKIIFLFLIVSLLLLAGCKEDMQPKNLTKNVSKKPELKVTAPEPEPEPEQEQESEPEGPYCGDGTCNRNENCDTCEDCACKSPAECHRAVCKVPECGGDGDCRDEDACTKDKCFFAQHPNAYCGHEQIEICKNRDDCCPEACTADNDNDCEPECGNDVCEPGETSNNCYDDCYTPVCGDQKCESGEDENNCAADCWQPVCGNSNCETGEDHNSCSNDCCEPFKWYPDTSTCNCPEGYKKEFDMGVYSCRT